MKLLRKFRSLIILAVILAVLFLAGTLLKNFALNQLKERIQSSLGYARLYVSTFPPELVMEDVRSTSTSPFFSAQKVSIRLSAKSLFSREKPFKVFVESPVLSVYASSSQLAEKKKFNLNMAFPFIVERGVIRNGELHYWGDEIRVHSKGVNAAYFQKGDQFSLKAELKENELSFVSEQQELVAYIDFFLEGIGEEIQVRKMKVVGPEGVIKTKGRIIDLFDPRIQMESTYSIQIPWLAKLLKLPFDWDGKCEGNGVLSREEGELSFVGNISSQTLVLSDVYMGDVNGNITYPFGGEGTLSLWIQKRGKRQEYINIRFRKNQAEGTVQGMYLDPIANFILMPWPVSSPAWGNFSFNNKKLTADVEFRDELIQVEPYKYPFRGKVKLDWDGVERVFFSSQEVESSFARVEVQGNLTVAKDMDITIRGDVTDGKQAREFTALALQKKFEFPEIRGEGEGEIHIFGDFVFPQVKANMTFSPAGFNKLDAANVKAEVELIKNDFFGRFEVEDPQFSGRIGLFTNLEEVRTDIWIDEGEIKVILPALDIDLPFEGQTNGYFEYRERDKTIQYSGSFSGERIGFAGMTLTQVKGKLEGDDENVRFPEFEFGLYGGEVSGSVLIQPLSQGFEIDAAGRGIDLSSFDPRLSGACHFELSGKGILGQDFVSGSYEIENLHFLPFQPTRSNGRLKLGYLDENLSVELEGGFFPGENPVTISLEIPGNQETLSGEIKGSFHNLDILMPWQGAKGLINYVGEIRGSIPSPQVRGVIDFEGSVLPFPRFAQAIREYSGLVFVDNGDFSIRSFQGKFGDGNIKGAGQLKIGLEGVEEIDVHADGSDMRLALLERTRAQADGNLRLLKDENQFVLEGEILVERLLWRRELKEKFSFSSTPYQLSQKEPGFFDDLTLNLRIRAEDDAWLENSLGQIRGRFDLSVTGNVFNPILLGEIEALEGNVDFQDRRFKILRGRVAFINPAVVEPYINFKGETYVKDYRVTFSLDGLLDKLNPEFSSSPPLPPEDVLALLAVGEAFRRTYHYDRSISQGTASLLSFTLAEGATRQTGKILGIDSFRIDPFFMGSSSEVTARWTIGERISRNFFVLYSTNLSTQREEIARIEWELSRDLSIVGTRDETGRLSIDVKVHKRF